MPLDAWQCDCKLRGNAARQQQQAHRPRFDCALEDREDGAEAEGAGTSASAADAGVMRGIKLWDEPCHGMCCPARHGRVIRRHDNVRDALARSLRAMPGVSAWLEPNLGDEEHMFRRADVKVQHAGTMWLVDVMVVNPATEWRVDRAHSATKPGAAASRGFRQKRGKYRELRNGMPSNVVVFVVETGGRFHGDAVSFVELMAERCAQEQASQGTVQASAGARVMGSRIYRAIDAELAKSAAHMMTRLLDDLAETQQRRMLQHEFQYQ